MLWLSGISVFGAIAGFVVGVMRVRVRRRYAKGAITPYRGWMAWHHLGGLVAGTTLVTFILSGWISMNPNRWFSPREPDRAALERYQGAPETPTEFDRRALAAACSGATEARFVRIGGEGQVILDCPWNTEKTCCDPMPAIGPERSARAAARLLPDSAAPEIERLTTEDSYWYGHHRERRLPVLRVRFADPAGTWFHIDPATGEILNRTDRSNRVYRWLFNAVHSFDFAFLIRYRPAWDLVLLALSAGGLTISLSGIVIAWRRLQVKLRRRVSTPVRCKHPASDGI